MPNTVAGFKFARKNKYDEFYTPLNVIEKEITHYKDHLKNKTILCNCDDPDWSAFWTYFGLKFHEFGLKKLICTHFGKAGNLWDNVTEPAYKIEFTGEGNPNSVGKKPLSGMGDFRSDECIEILKEADIIITNPPFSLFREYIQQLMDYNKKFIIIGNMNAVTYKQIIPYFLNNELWVGASPHRIWFNVPHTFQITSSNVKYDENGKPLIQVGNACWFTNLSHKKRNQEIKCFAKYDPVEYPKYDNYDAIEVNNITKIPKDYNGKMGVPITFIFKHNPNQFKLLGTGRTISTTNGKGDLLVNGKGVYQRFIIQRV